MAFGALRLQMFSIKLKLGLSSMIKLEFRIEFGPVENVVTSLTLIESGLFGCTVKITVTTLTLFGCTQIARSIRLRSRG